MLWLPSLRRQRELLDALDRASADYIITRALATNKMPMQIIGEDIHTEDR